MGADTKIGWTTHTFSPWWGCTEAGPGCDFCYARDLDHRWGGDHWGPGRPRRLIKNWQLPRVWNQIARETGERPWVFPSMCDPFDNEVPQEWRSNFWDLIRSCTYIRWQLLTKRVGNVLKMVPSDWPENFSHVGIMATIVNQEEMNRDGPKLRRVKTAGASWVGMSIEPQLGYVDCCEALGIWWNQREHAWVREHAPWLDWAITGGESGHKSKVRPYYINWTYSLIETFGAADVPLFVKQMGTRPMQRVGQEIMPLSFKHPKGEDSSEWPADLRVQQMPRVYDREQYVPGDV